MTYFILSQEILNTLIDYFLLLENKKKSLRFLLIGVMVITSQWFQSALVAESFFSLIILSIFVFSVLGKKNYKFLNHPLMTKFDLKKLCNLSSILKFTFLYELLNGFIYKSCSVVSLTLKLGFLSAGGFNLLSWIYNVQKACRSRPPEAMKVQNWQPVEMTLYIYIYINILATTAQVICIYTYIHTY